MAVVSSLRTPILSVPNLAIDRLRHVRVQNPQVGLALIDPNAQ
jgi:hypothetical protein